MAQVNNPQLVLNLTPYFVRRGETINSVKLTTAVNAGAGLTGGGALTSDVTIDVGAGNGITVNTDDITIDLKTGSGLTVDGDGLYMTTPTSNLSHNSTNAVAAGGHTHAIDASSAPGSAASLLKTDASGILYVDQFGNTGDILMDPDVDLDLNPGGNLVLRPDSALVRPETTYTTNIGSSTYKFLTLHAAELNVATLVAENVMTTIGGRIIIAPSTELIADVSNVDTNIQVKHNNLGDTTGENGDFILLEADGNVEWMQILVHDTPDSGKIWATVSGGYEYKVTRNLDGTGANDWAAGSAVSNAGQAGDGFIDLFSTQGVHGSGSGPSIVFSAYPTGATLYNDFEVRMAVGNLNGLYGVATNSYGVAIGDPNDNYAVFDDTNGIRFLDSLGNTLAQLTGNAWTIGDTGAEHLQIDSSDVRFLNGATTLARLNASTWTLGDSSLEHIQIDANSIKFIDGATAETHASLANSTFTLGVTTREHIRMTTAALQWRDGATTYFNLSSGQMVIGESSGDNIYIDNNEIRFRVGTTIYGHLNGTEWILGDVATENVQITATAINLRDATTVLTSVSGGVVTVGDSSTEHVEVTATAINFNDGATTLASLSGAEWIIGSTATENIQITSSAINIRDATTNRMVISGTTITIGAASAPQTTVSDAGILIQGKAGVQTIYAQSDGDVFIGSDLSGPSTTYFSVFSVAQTYNSESMGAGDLLIGDNSAGGGPRLNIFYDYSENQLQFRNGTTAVAYVDAGNFFAAEGDIKLGTTGLELAIDVGGKINWIDSGNLDAEIYAYQDAGDNSEMSIELRSQGAASGDYNLIGIYNYSPASAVQADATAIFLYNNYDQDEEYIVLTGDGTNFNGVTIGRGKGGTQPGAMLDVDGDMILRGALWVNETVNTDLTLGLTINQGASDDQIMAFKSSDVAHGFTSLLETDTYGFFEKYASTTGGMRVAGLGESSVGLHLEGWVNTEDTSSSTAALGAVLVDAYKQSFTNRTSLGNTANLFTIRNNGNARLALKGNGDLHYDGTTNAGSWDEYNDAHLVRALSLAQGQPGILESKFDQFIEYNADDLEAMGIISREDGRLFIKLQGITALHNGAIWQLYERIMKLESLLAAN